MKISQKFKDIETPSDIDQAELAQYLQGLYGEDKFDIKDSSYDIEGVDFAKNWVNFSYKRQIDRIITELVALSDLNAFEDLRDKYEKPISAGETRDSAEELKTFAELICFKLATRKDEVNLRKFEDEVKSATLDKCVGGAINNFLGSFVKDIIKNIILFIILQRIMLEKEN